MTISGIVIGVGAIILLLSLGQGAKTYFSQEIRNLGPNLVYVLPGKVEWGRPPIGQNKITLREFKGVKKSLNLSVAAVLEKEVNVESDFGARNVVVKGVTASYPRVAKVSLKEGEFIRESQVSEARRVVVLGKKVSRDLFGHHNPSKKRITLGDQRLTVIGTMQRGKRSFREDPNEVVYIPITTAQNLFLVDEVSYILVKAPISAEISATVLRTKKVLEKTLGNDDFSVGSLREVLSLFQRILGNLTWFLVGIAGISLFTAGMGMMNLMLTKVAERKREIGLRKAVGAKASQIMSQFLVEALVLCVLGGMGGIVLGIGSSLFLKSLYPVTLTIRAILLTLLLSGMVGIFFGFYPAYKASRLNPSQVLR